MSRLLVLPSSGVTSLEGPNPLPLKARGNKNADRNSNLETAGSGQAARARRRKGNGPLFRCSAKRRAVMGGPVSRRRQACETYAGPISGRRPRRSPQAGAGGAWKDRRRRRPGVDEKDGPRSRQGRRSGGIRSRLGGGRGVRQTGRDQAHRAQT